MDSIDFLHSSILSMNRNYLSVGSMPLTRKLPLTLALFLFSISASAFQVEQFSIPTADKSTQLTGEFNFPDSADNKSLYPLVLMVAGTGLFDRTSDVSPHMPELPKDSILFEAISKNLTQLGVATLRFDFRGVSCSLRNVACEGCNPTERLQKYLSTCIDNDVRLGVTPKTYRDDIEAVFNLANQHAKVDKKRIVFFGHSEGSVHLSRVVHNRKITPSALVFMGGVAESPHSVVRWQMIERIVEGIVAMDSDKDGETSNEEIDKNLKNSILSAFPPQALHSPTGSWTRQSIQAQQEQNYKLTNEATLAADPQSRYPESGPLIQASQAWWQMWFKDKTRGVDLLSQFPGPIVFHLGDRDSQTDFRRQRDLIDRMKASKINRAEFSVVKHEGMGHCLGAHPTLGPLSNPSLSVLIESIAALTKESTEKNKQ